MVNVFEDKEKISFFFFTETMTSKENHKEKNAIIDVHLSIRG